jgi:KaiC/GvpD/RAD55 family RecA-like ATPase
MENSRKISSSIIGLDSLLNGGITKGSMCLLFGPPFCGKKLLLFNFLYEQLKNSNPVIFVLTDFGYNEFKAKLKNLNMDISGPQKENKCFFIDVYSKQYSPTLQDTENIKYISSPSALSEISLALSKIKEDFNLKDFFVGWHSLSTLLKCAPTSNSFFRFLRFEIGKFKELNATAFFTLEKYLHSKEDETSIIHLMDGVIEFENSKVRVKGFDTFDDSFHSYTISDNGISIL